MTERTPKPSVNAHLVAHATKREACPVAAAIHLPRDPHRSNPTLSLFPHRANPLHLAAASPAPPFSCGDASPPRQATTARTREPRAHSQVLHLELLSVLPDPADSSDRPAAEPPEPQQPVTGATAALTSQHRKARGLLLFPLSLVLPLTHPSLCWICAGAVLSWARPARACRSPPKLLGGRVMSGIGPCRPDPPVPIVDLDPHVLLVSPEPGAATTIAARPTLFHLVFVSCRYM
ncbi:uncharacterized protein LOC123405412 [Hordeum vulgare subsp. vulgare]|uniref:uncharacterized protein LOC123405412 n=1 Tax=Hordeum vulgare subsp. vulgare TaxID=112509 RepID=UPI001D1A3E71|nr:uncharacterized protein LOC123405412 [Hordeum vulgare subsp. vulgare]